MKKNFDHCVYFIRRYPTQGVADAGGGNNNLETPLLNAPLWPERHLLSKNGSCLKKQIVI